MADLKKLVQVAHDAIVDADWGQLMLTRSGDGAWEAVLDLDDVEASARGATERVTERYTGTGPFAADALSQALQAAGVTS